jgi:hypothetical protein
MNALILISLCSVLQTDVSVAHDTEQPRKTRLCPHARALSSPLYRKCFLSMQARAYSIPNFHVTTLDRVATSSAFSIGPSAAGNSKNQPPNIKGVLERSIRTITQRRWEKNNFRWGLIRISLCRFRAGPKLFNRSAALTALGCTPDRWCSPSQGYRRGY